jgi:hypothetical protein
MSYDSIVGTVGVSLILLAYFLQTFGLMQRGKSYFLLNTVGAALACYASLLIHYWPFVVLEGVWTLVSIIGFFNSLFREERNSIS